MRKCGLLEQKIRGKSIRDATAQIRDTILTPICGRRDKALHETRVFRQKLFSIPGLKLEREPDISWNDQLKRYELRNAVISCDHSA